MATRTEIGEESIKGKLVAHALTEAMRPLCSQGIVTEIDLINGGMAWLLAVCDVAELTGDQRIKICRLMADLLI